MGPESGQKKIRQLREELNRARSELYVLYEISNAMRASLKLDDLLYIILTGVTAHAGLGFNRAMLFLKNERQSTIEGKMGIGPHTGEEANRIWKQIEVEKSTLNDLIANYESSHKMQDSLFNRLVTGLRFPLSGEDNLVSLCILRGTPLCISPRTIRRHKDDPLLRKIYMEEFAVVPLNARGKIIGAILVDNLFNKKSISKDDLRLLTMFANQAGLAIENSRLYEQTVLQSQTDSLTRLWNHGYFQHKLQEEIKVVRKEGSYLSLILLDLDNFKELNDTLGHYVGDIILKDVSRILKRHCRCADYPCRYGGEEFAVILSRATKKEAYLIAERIRQAIARHKFYYKKNVITKSISLSIGLATFGEDGVNTKADLLSCADKALYIAKHTGKNKTQVYRPF